MFFVLEDDGCVHIYGSPDDVVHSIEGLDAEECIRAAFDERGRPHRMIGSNPITTVLHSLGFNLCAAVGMPLCLRALQICQDSSNSFKTTIRYSKERLSWLSRSCLPVSASRIPACDVVAVGGRHLKELRTDTRMQFLLAIVTLTSSRYQWTYCRSMKGRAPYLAVVGRKLSTTTSTLTR
jgi:hypothetical protein